LQSASLNNKKMVILCTTHTKYMCPHLLLSSQTAMFTGSGVGPYCVTDDQLWPQCRPDECGCQKQCLTSLILICMSVLTADDCVELNFRDCPLMHLRHKGENLRLELHQKDGIQIKVRIVIKLM